MANFTQMTNNQQNLTLEPHVLYVCALRFWSLCKLLQVEEQICGWCVNCWSYKWQEMHSFPSFSILIIQMYFRLGYMSICILYSHTTDVFLYIPGNGWVQQKKNKKQQTTASTWLISQVHIVSGLITQSDIYTQQHLKPTLCSWQPAAGQTFQSAPNMTTWIQK